MQTLCHNGDQCAAKLPGVAYATDYLYMCSGPGQDMIQEAIDVAVVLNALRLSDYTRSPPQR